MKTNFKLAHEESKFKPIEMSAIFETEAEARVLMAFLGAMAPLEATNIWKRSEQSYYLNLSSDEVLSVLTNLNDKIRSPLKNFMSENA